MKRIKNGDFSFHYENLKKMTEFLPDEDLDSRTKENYQREATSVAKSLEMVSKVEKLLKNVAGKPIHSRKTLEDRFIDRFGDSYAQTGTGDVWDIHNVTEGSFEYSSSSVSYTHLTLPTIYSV